MLAEIYKATGCSSGRGGSMHLVDNKIGFMGSTAIVGNHSNWCRSCTFTSTREITGSECSFCGDGSLEEGVFYNSNFAAVRKLPVLFVCENNLYPYIRIYASDNHKVAKYTKWLKLLEWQRCWLMVTILRRS